MGAKVLLRAVRLLRHRAQLQHPPLPRPSNRRKLKTNRQVAPVRRLPIQTQTPTKSPGRHFNVISVIFHWRKKKSKKKKKKAAKKKKKKRSSSKSPAKPTKAELREKAKKEAEEAEALASGIFEKFREAKGRQARSSLEEMSLRILQKKFGTRTLPIDWMVGPPWKDAARSEQKFRLVGIQEGIETDRFAITDVPKCEIFLVTETTNAEGADLTVFNMDINNPDHSVPINNREMVEDLIKMKMVDGLPVPLHPYAINKRVGLFTFGGNTWRGGIQEWMAMNPHMVHPKQKFTDITIYYNLDSDERKHLGQSDNRRHQYAVSQTIMDNLHFVRTHFHKLWIDNHSSETKWDDFLQVVSGRKRSKGSYMQYKIDALALLGIKALPNNKYRALQKENPQLVNGWTQLGNSYWFLAVALCQPKVWEAVVYANSKMMERAVSNYEKKTSTAQRGRNLKPFDPTNYGLKQVHYKQLFNAGLADEQIISTLRRVGSNEWDVGSLKARALVLKKTNKVLAAIVSAYDMDPTESASSHFKRLQVCQPEKK